MSELVPNSTAQVIIPKEISGWRYLLLTPPGLMLRWWMMSLRIEIDEELSRHMKSQPKGVIFAVWHNRSFVSTRVHQHLRPRDKQLWALVSASRDGAWQAALLKQMGVQTIRGSSSKRAAVASRQLIDVARKGHDLGIAIDGPRGPVYTAQPGAAWLIQKSGNPFLLGVPNFSRAWRAKSWDGYQIPKPFSRVKVVAQSFSSAEELSTSTDREQFAHDLNERMRFLTHGLDSSN